MTNDTKLINLIDKLLQDPLLLQKLSDRIYERMQQDQQNRWDRDRVYNPYEW